MNDPNVADFVLHVVPRLESEARQARATLRQLEQDTGRTATESGAYWLARTAAFEHLAEAARQAVATQDLTLLHAPLHTLSTIPAPVCHPADHAGRGGSNE